MRILAGLGAVVILGWLVVTTDLPRAPSLQACTPEWFSYLSNHYFDVSDGEGHGPDPGSSEWLGSVQRQIGLRAGEHISDARRCQLIQSHLEHHAYVVNHQLGWVISF
jgi:hypothetical protein